jgi:hypothetical protein
MAFYPQFYHKTDREGRPIYIEQLGKLDTSKLAALTNQDRQLHHLVDEYEKFLGKRLPATSKEVGGLVETSCTILDLTNAGISTFYKGTSGGWGGARREWVSGGDWTMRIAGSSLCCACSSSVALSPIPCDDVWGFADNSVKDYVSAASTIGQNHCKLKLFPSRAKLTAQTYVKTTR